MGKGRKMGDKRIGKVGQARCAGDEYTVGLPFSKGSGHGYHLKR